MTSGGTHFEPRTLHDHFLRIVALPHPSGREDPVREYVAREAARLGIDDIHYRPEATSQGERVVVVRRPGSGPFADQPWVVLQAHLDMVTVPHDRIFPIEPFPLPETGWIGARGDGGRCTLGADNGIGVAAILTALADPALARYPLEGLFTVREETDMGGARELAPERLKGRRLLNLDSEERAVITYGSAGGINCRYTLPLERRAGDEGFTTLRVELAGLRGGHSGIDINRGRANAVKLLASALAWLNRRLNRDGGEGACGLRLVEIGQPPEHDKANAIPTTATALVRVPRERSAPFTRALGERLAACRQALQPVETGMRFSIEPCDEPGPAMDEASTDAVLGLLGQIPHGVVRMIPVVPDTVESSCNMAITRSGDETLTVTVSNRSSNDAELERLVHQHELVGERFGAAVASDRAGAYPAWQPDEGSALLAAAWGVYREIYPDEAERRVIHAGLECGYLVQKYRERGEAMECVSIGPTIVDPHTVNERLDGRSVAPFYQALSRILHRLFEGDRPVTP